MLTINVNAPYQQLLAKPVVRVCHRSVTHSRIVRPCEVAVAKGLHVVKERELPEQHERLVAYRLRRAYADSGSLQA